MDGGAAEPSHYKTRQGFSSRARIGEDLEGQTVELEAGWERHARAGGTLLGFGLVL